MDFSQTFAISAAGMQIERLRVDVAAMNLAYANTMQTPEGGYQPMRVVAQVTGRASSSFGDTVSRWLGNTELAVASTGAQPRNVYEPGNPFADTRGYVQYPNVDSATEMMNMMSATRAYEANIAAMNMAKTMALKALDIGGAA